MRWSQPLVPARSQARLTLQAKLAATEDTLTKRIFLSSYAVNVSFAEQTLGTEEQEDQRQDVGEPVLDAAAERGPEIALGELFPEADDEPADDRARDRGEAAEDHHRQRL